MRAPGGTTGLRAVLLLAAIFGAAALAQIESCPEPATADGAPAILETDDSADAPASLLAFDADVASASLDEPRLLATPAPRRSSPGPNPLDFRRLSVSRAPPSRA
jgi:hypothetical protein